ncbi:MAG: hypothetical protein IPQ07_32360 [Myxococcales bacterium]|nr:hypothetical protein [Myxococcales bacterium]
MSTARGALAGIVVGLFAACSSRKAPEDRPPPVAPPVRAEAAVAPAPKVTGACVPKAVGDLGVAYARTDGATLATVCFGTGDEAPGATNACLQIDREGKATAGRSWEDAMVAFHATSATAAPPTVTVQDREVTVCPAGRPGCVHVQIPPVKFHPNRPPHGVASASMKRLFLFVPEPIPGRGATAFTWYGDTYDLKAGKRLAHVRLDTLLADHPAFSNTFHVFEASWVGDGRVLLTDHIDVGPEFEAMLLDPIEGKALFLADQASQLSVIDPTTIVSFRGTQLQVVDAPALRVIGTFTAASEIGAAIPWLDRILVVHARPPGTLQIDPKTATAYTGAPLPLCW